MFSAVVVRKGGNIYYATIHRKPLSVEEISQGFVFKTESGPGETLLGVKDRARQEARNRGIDHVQYLDDVK
jgi:hypothetical protein